MECKKDSPYVKEISEVGVIPDLTAFSASIFASHAAMYNFPLNCYCVKSAKADNIFKWTEYIVDKDRDELEMYSFAQRNDPYPKEFLAQVAATDYFIKLPKTFKLPDGSTVTVYGRNYAKHMLAPVEP